MDISKSYSYNPFVIVVSVSLMVFSSMEDNRIMNLTKLYSNLVCEIVANIFLE